MQILFNFISDQLGAMLKGWADFFDAMKQIDFDSFMYFMTYGGGFLAFMKGFLRAQYK